MNKPDAFTSGVVPGGLTERSQILLMLCVLLSGARRPLGREPLLHAISEEGLANYFEVTGAISELLERGHLVEAEPDALSITESGRRIADTLLGDLPLTIRERSAKVAAQLSRRAEIEHGASAEILEADGGWRIVCRLSDGAQEVLCVSLLVDTRAQAEAIRRQYLLDPMRMFSGVWALGTGDFSSLGRIAQTRLA